MRKLEWIFLVLGLVLFLVLLDRVGWEEILRRLRTLGWVFLLVLGVSGCRYLCRAAAWRCAFAGRQDTPSFRDMFQMRLAGEAIAYLTVAGPLLGEPAKATLLRRRMPMLVGLGVTLIEAGIYGLTSILVILVGLVLGLLRVTMDEKMQRAGWVGALLLALFLLAVAWLLRRRVRFLSAAVNWLARGRLGPWLAPHRPRLTELEDHLLRFYGEHARDFRTLFLWNCLAQAFAMLEIYIILGALGLRATWEDLLILEGTTKVFKTLFFFIPARVGTDEGAMAAVFQVIGLGFSQGISLALVRRLRALVWSAAGLVFLSRYALRRSR